MICAVKKPSPTKSLKLLPSAGFQSCRLLLNETKIHCNCKQYALFQHKATHCKMPIDDNWLGSIKYQQSSREKHLSKDFLAQPRLHTVVSEEAWRILMCFKAAEVHLKITNNSCSGKWWRPICRIKLTVMLVHVLVARQRKVVTICFVTWTINRNVFILLGHSITHELSSVSDRPGRDTCSEKAPHKTMINNKLQPTFSALSSRQVSF